jgi:hypothetical protein
MKKAGKQIIFMAVITGAWRLPMTCSSPMPRWQVSFIVIPTSNS